MQEQSSSTLIYPIFKDNCKNVILIDNTVPDFLTFFNSSNDNTYPIIYSSNDSRESLISILRTKFQSIERLSIAFVNDSHNKSFLSSEMMISNNNKEFIISLIKEFNIKNIDYLGCNTLQYNSWKQYYDELHKETNVIVGASNDRTGNLSLGGNWIMESTTEDIQNIYFTNEITNYSHLLDFGDFSVLIKNDGTLYGCGNNVNGQYTYNNVAGSIVDSGFSLLQEMNIQGKTVASVSCGQEHTVVLMNDGSVYACGANSYGQLGNGTTTRSNILVPMTMPRDLSGNLIVDSSGNPLKATSVSCGQYYTTVVMNDGSVYACGTNTYGQLGNGTRTNSNILVPMTMPKDSLGNLIVDLSGNPLKATSVSCGQSYTVVLMNNGLVYACGDNSYGQFGNGTTTNSNILTLMTMPRDLSDNLIVDSSGNPLKATSVSCGYYHTVVIMNNGLIYACGRNNYGQLGNGTLTDWYVANTSLTLMTMPKDSLGNLIVDLSGNPLKVTQVSCGQNHTVVLMNNGLIYACGANGYGQFGNGTTTSSKILVPMTMPRDLSGNLIVDLSGNPLKATQVSCGYQYTVVLMNNGLIYACGINGNGQLGNGTTTSSKILVPMTMPKDLSGNLIVDLSGNPLNATQVSCGESHTVVLMNNSSVYACGTNGNGGQLGIGFFNSGISKTILTLFYNFPTNKRATQVSCGYYHTVVLMNDGSVYACGANSYGQLGNGTRTNSNILVPMTMPKDSLGNLIVDSSGNPLKATSVSCGYYHTVVLMNNGLTYACGRNNYGQLGNGLFNISANPVLTPMTMPRDLSGNLIVDSLGNPLKVTQVSCGGSHTIVLMNNGLVYACGDNGNGQFGNGTTTNSNILTLMTMPRDLSDNLIVDSLGNPLKATQVSCGESHTVVLMNNGLIYACGINGNGQLGNGSFNYSANPVLTPMTTIPTGLTATQVSCGQYHTTVLMNNGLTYACGRNNYGQLGNGLFNISSNPVLTPMTMPRDLSGNLIVDSLGNPLKVTQVSCGQNHTVVLMDNSSVYACGANWNGQLGTGLNDYTNKNVLTLMVNGTGFVPFYTDINSNICFLDGSLVKTDQGLIPIETIDTTVHTINNNKILHVTKTITKHNFLICIEKDSIGKHMPSQTTYVTKDHKILYKGKMVKAIDLIGKTGGAHKVEYNGELLYNVLLEKSDKMIVNNLIAETLDPEHIISKIYTKIKSKKMRDYLLEENNYCISNNDNIRYNALYSAIDKHIILNNSVNAK